jgi:hypothetical protein
MLKLPVKEIIVNKDSQVRLLEDDGTAYAAADATPSAGGFILEGYLSLTLGSQLVLLKAATRIIKDATAAGVAQIATFTVSSTSALKGDVFRIVSTSMDLTPTQYQNRDVEERYQLSSDQSSAANLAAHIRDTINANKNSKVTASAAGAVVTITHKEKGVTFGFFSSKILGAFAITTPAALPVNTYDTLKNRNWATNLDFDRNVEYFPEYGATYVSYYFEVDRAGFVGGQTVPSEKNVTSRTGYRLYVKTGSALITALDLLVTDMNV